MIRGLLVVGTLLSLITLASRLASKHLVLDVNSEQWSATVKTCHQFDSWT
jgi:hypothetical protein